MKFIVRIGRYNAYDPNFYVLYKLKLALCREIIS